VRAALLAAAIFLLAAPSALAAGKLHVKIVGQDHRPKVGAKWHYSVTVTDAGTGKRVACRLHLQFVFGSIPVGQVGTHLLKAGFWQETFGTPGNPAFPAASRDQRVTLQAVATAKGYAKASAGWWVQPR
jgi:hypothetical protein